MGDSEIRSSLWTLPSELILEIPQHLSDIEDLINLRATCRYFRNTLSSTSPQVVLQLCHGSSHPVFQPKPWLLLSFVARAVSTWSLQSPENLRKFKTALLHGPEEVLSVAISEPAIAAIAKFDLGMMTEIQEWRGRILKPLSDFMDKCIGQQWMSQPNFWQDVDDAVTLYSEPEETLFHWLVYGEFFGGQFESWLDPTSSPTTRVNARREGRMTGSTSNLTSGDHHDIYTRLSYVKYLISDPSCFRVMHTSGNDVLPYDEFPIPPDDPFGKVIETRFGRFVHPVRAVQGTVGPYIGMKDWRNAECWKTEPQVAMSHLLDRSTLWFRSWNSVRTSCGADFVRYPEPLGEEAYYDISWKQEAWQSAITCMGFESFELLASEISPDNEPGCLGSRIAVTKAKMGRFEKALRQMDERPRTVRLANFALTAEFPYLRGDVYICQYK
jgi:hypothetical protein